MKKNMLKCLALFLCISLAACGTPAASQASAGGEEEAAPAGEVYTMKLANANAVGSIKDEVSIMFADLAREKSGGRIDIQVYSGGTLGDWSETSEGLSLGVVQIVIEGIGSLEKFSPKASFEAIPYAMKDYDAILALGQRDQKALEQLMAQYTGYVTAILCDLSRGALVVADFPTVVVAQRMFSAMDSIPLLAIPFFILAGNLMGGSITQKILDTANALFGSVKGSLGVVTVAASALFSAISGSGVATASAIGGITIPGMKDEGYPGDFAGALAAISATMGPLIPPSIFLIVYGSATESSVADLFMAAVIPGVSLALVLAVYVLLYAKKHNFPAREKVPLKQAARTALDSVWALFMPVLILGGIFLGIFTATEAAAVSVLYAFLVSLLIYKDLKLKNVLSIFGKSAVTTSSLLFVMGVSKASSWIIVTSGLPTLILDFFESITSNPAVIILLVNILLFIVGMLMEGNAAIVMLTPLLMPLVERIGMSPIQFGVVMALNLCLGLVTPPVGGCLMIGNMIAEERLERTLKAILPMLGLGIIILMLTTYIPGMTLWLPAVAKG
jgi:tripartite ATP-independent transporter DctM subunit